MMKLYVGLDVSVEMTSICAVDEDGRLCLEAKTLTDPEFIGEALSGLDRTYERVGLEAAPEFRPFNHLPALPISTFEVRQTIHWSPLF